MPKLTNPMTFTEKYCHNYRNAEAGMDYDRSLMLINQGATEENLTTHNLND